MLGAKYHVPPFHPIASQLAYFQGMSPRLITHPSLVRPQETPPLLHKLLRFLCNPENG